MCLGVSRFSEAPLFCSIGYKVTVIHPLDKATHDAFSKVNGVFVVFPLLFVGTRLNVQECNTYLLQLA